MKETNVSMSTGNLKVKCDTTPTEYLFDIQKIQGEFLASDGPMFVENQMVEDLKQVAIP